ncbi:MAG TPA: hypothetical protein DDZ88_25250 [Verrucomicrobiales bacterium]|nr:hypothetical protein [Verrucomicrobiales bacterium]
MDDANPGTTGNFVVGIYANNTSGVPDPRPGALIGTLSGSLAPTTAGDYTYTATPGSIQLTSGQTYWLVAGAPNTTGSGESYRWNVSSTTNYTTQTSGWSVNPALAVALFDNNYQTDTGSWTDNPVPTNDNIVFRTTSTPGPATNDYGGDFLLQFSLSASAAAVPEPSKAAFVMLGLFGLWLPRKRVNGR